MYTCFIYNKGFMFWLMQTSQMAGSDLWSPGENIGAYTHGSALLAQNNNKNKPFQCIF